MSRLVHGPFCSVRIRPFLHDTHFGLQLGDSLFQLRRNFIEKLKTYPNYNLFLSVLDQIYVVHLYNFQCEEWTPEHSLTESSFLAYKEFHTECCNNWFDKNRCFLTEAQFTELREFKRTNLGFIWIKPCEFSGEYKFSYLEFIGSFLQRGAQFTNLVMEIFPYLNTEYPYESESPKVLALGDFLLPREIANLSQERYFLKQTYHHMAFCDNTVITDVLNAFSKEDVNFQRASPFVTLFERLYEFSIQDHDWDEGSWSEVEKILFKKFFQIQYGDESSESEKEEDEEVSSSLSSDSARIQVGDSDSESDNDSNSCFIPE